MTNFKRIFNQNMPRSVILVIDLLTSIFSFALANLIIEAFSIQDIVFVDVTFSIIAIISIRLIGFLATRSYTGIIRYTSTQDAVRIFFAVSISSLLLLLFEGTIYYLTGKLLIKPAVLVIDAFILIFFLSAFRILFKLLYKHYNLSNYSKGGKDVIIYGAGEAGALVKRSIEQNSTQTKRVIAFLDDNKKLINKSVEGVKIYNPSTDLMHIVKDRLNTELVIAINSINPRRKKNIIESSLEHGIAVKTIPPVSAWINGEFNPRSIKAVKIEDLLERDPIVLNKKKIISDLKDQTILITGAAGSIGSEIVRQSLKFKPKSVLLVDQGETPLYEIEKELESETNIEIVVADVCNAARMERVFQFYSPNYVFHAAAYKHVPLMEDNPYEALNNNVLGTQIVANLSNKYKVKKFVFVSTDKAVNPTNIMGASKRIAEMYVQSLNAKLNLESDSHTKYITTRFGNVLGSNGSVIPLFTKQIENGGPITVTHREITRYFMTIPEACQLVLEASVMGSGGEIFIFDMGKSVKIVDLARKMISLSGLKEGLDIEIKFTGLRPGEKLKEELLNHRENTIGTHNPKIMVAKVPEYNYLEINQMITDMFQDQETLGNKKLVQIMKKIVPEYKSNNSIYEALDKK